MRKLAMLAAATLAATALSATPALADPVVYTDCSPGNCFSPLTVVNIDSGTTGHVGNSDVNVFFSSTTDDLVNGGSGQASFHSPLPDNLINNITFELEAGFGFYLAEVNLSDAPSDATLTITTAGGDSQVMTINLNGNNRFGIDATAFGLLTSATLNSPQGFENFLQLRFGQIYDLQGNPVPEPATWAMMLMGFGATGIALRRSRRRKGLLTQIA